MKTAVLIAVCAGLAVAAGAQAIDLEELRKALEKPKQRPAQTQPGGQQAAPGQPAKAKPDLSDLIGVVRGVSAEEETAIGRQIAGNLLGAAPLVKDAKLQAYVNRVGRWVASRSGRPDLKWTFGVIESADINAFAAPGGYVFVTRGLYARLQDEAQLAGVLAHEVGHVQQKHHLKLLQQQQLLGAGTSILSKKLKDKASVQRLIGSGAEIFARGLDKSAEFEADRIGVVLATRAGYDPYGLPAVLQDIGAVSKDAGNVALLFKTHPHPDERLAQLSEAMGERFDGVKDARNLPERLHPLK
jgi:predicted Zn-dependent protease